MSWQGVWWYLLYRLGCSSTPTWFPCYRGSWCFPSCGWERYLSPGSIGRKKWFHWGRWLGFILSHLTFQSLVFSVSIYFINFVQPLRCPWSLEALLGHTETEPKSKVPRVLILQSLPSWNFAKQTKHKGYTKSGLTTWFLRSFGHNSPSVLALFFLASLSKLICHWSFLMFCLAAETTFSAFLGRKYVWLTVHRYESQTTGFEFWLWRWLLWFGANYLISKSQFSPL